MNVDQMLRSVSAGRLQELMDFEVMESPEVRMDLRFSILAAIVAASGHVQAADGQQYSQIHFLKHLQNCLERHDSMVLGTAPEYSTKSPTQSAETQRLLVESWISGVNSSFREDRSQKQKQQRPLYLSSRALLSEHRGRL